MILALDILSSVSRIVTYRRFSLYTKSAIFIVSPVYMPRFRAKPKSRSQESEPNEKDNSLRFVTSAHPN